MGTVLSSVSGVTTGTYNDFFFVGHRALQGTAKPLRYVLLMHGWTDKDRPHGDVPELTEHALVRELMPLHMMNARAQKACQLPAPVKFAHLAAERANLHNADRWSVALHAGLLH